MTHTLTMFNTGQITLPKKRRTQFDTKKFVAVETNEGLLIKPLTINHWDDIVYYESQDGFGIYSDAGIDPEQIIASIQQLHNHG